MENYIFWAVNILQNTASTKKRRPKPSCFNLKLFLGNYN